VAKGQVFRGSILDIHRLSWSSENTTSQFWDRMTWVNGCSGFDSLLNAAASGPETPPPLLNRYIRKCLLNHKPGMRMTIVVEKDRYFTLRKLNAAKFRAVTGSPSAVRHDAATLAAAKCWKDRHSFLSTTINSPLSFHLRNHISIHRVAKARRPSQGCNHDRKCR